MDMNKLVGKMGDGFAALRYRDRVIAVVGVAVVLVLGSNLLLLKPQALVINALKTKEGSIATELAETRKILGSMTSLEDKGIDPFAAERATLAELLDQVKKVDSLIGKDGSSAAQVGILVRGLIKSNPGLTLVSLKTRPGVVFYTPPAPPVPKQGAQAEIDKVLARVKKEEDVKPAPPPVVLVKQPLYKHGIEVSVKGAYPALMAYLDEMQKLPQRIYWSEASLDAGNHREATLKLLVHTVSDLPVSPLN